MSWCLFPVGFVLGFVFSASRSRCLSWKGKRLRAMTHRMPTTSPRLVAIQEMMTTGDSLSVWIMYATYSETMALQFQSWMPTNTIAVTASIPRRMMDSHRLAFRALSLLIFWACSSSSCSFCRFRSFARSRLNSRAVSVVSSSASNMETVRGLGVVPFSVVVAVSSAFSSSLTESGVEENALL